MKRTNAPKRNSKPRSRPRKASKAVAAVANDSRPAEGDSEAEGKEQAIGPAVPVVGIGASAGGLEAFSEILDALGPQPEYGRSSVALRDGPSSIGWKPSGNRRKKILGLARTARACTLLNL